MLRLLKKLLRGGGACRASRGRYLAEPLEQRMLLTRLAVIGDYSSDTQTAPTRDVSQLVTSWNPDAVFTAGDNNYPHGAASTIDANIGQWYHQFIFPYTGSYGSGSADGQNHFWPALGNHDYDTNNGQAYFNYFTLPNNERYYTEQIGNIAVFVVDSESNDPDGVTSTSVQANWIKSQMLASSAPWKIVIFHEPFYSSGPATNSNMNWPFASWGATAVITGHDHQYERLLEGGLTYFVDGLGGESIFDFSTTVAGSQVRYNADYGAMRIDSTNTSITFSFITRTGQVIDTYTVGTPVPNPPGNLHATASPGQIALSWNASSGATSYKVYRGTSPGGESTTPIATNVTGTSFTDTGVTAGNTYYYEVTAVNAAGESALSTEASASLAPPALPTGVLAQGGITQIALSWGSSAGAASYRIYRGTSPGGENAAAYATNVTATSFADTGLTSGSTFYYTITAVNGLGESSKSSEVTATVVVPPAHVVVVIEAHFNTMNVLGPEDAPGAPYISSLADQGALFSNAQGVTYPGQPNYLALFSGSTQGVTSDTVPSSQFTTANLGSELIAAGLTFTGYAQGLPSAGSLVTSSGAYFRYHNPWSEFSNVPAADNQPFTSFPTNFATLPTVSFVVPDFNNDMHDGTIAQADTWLQTNLGAYATWASTHNSLLIVTWDDNDSGTDPNNPIATIIYGQQVQVGAFADSINHYNVLRTIEDLYGVARLGAAASAATIQDSWASPLQSPAAPSNLRAAGGLNQIALTWGASPGAAMYSVYRGTSAGGESMTPIATGVTGASFIDTQLPSEASYYYQVTAVNAAGASPRSTEATATVLQPPAHVVIVVEENEDASAIIGSSSAPYINSLAQNGAYFTNFDAITHPSQPNYLALFSGSTQGVTDDTLPAAQFSGPDLGSALIAAGLSFVGYAEGLPAVGSLVESAGPVDPAGAQVYQRKHNPWSDFADVPASDNQPFTSFPSNFDQLPTVSFVVPNMMDDMHDATIAQGDSWLQSNLSAYATWAQAHNSLLIVTWDEDETGDSVNQIPSIFYGQQVQTGTYGQNFTHYGTLATIEKMYGLPLLGASATAVPMAGVWNSVLQPPPPVQNVQANASGPQQIALSWPISVGAASYKIYRSTTSGGEGTVPLATNITTPNFNDTGLTPGVTYFYQVVAVDAAGSSAASLETNVATPRATPLFAGLNSTSIVYGASTTTLSGSIAAGTLIPPGNVTIMINGSSTNAAINATTGAFSANFDTHAIPTSATAYTITYSYAGNSNFNSASDTSKTLTVNKRTLHVTATGVNKTYDGTIAATVTLGDDRVNSDAIITAYTTAAFTAKNVGTGVTVNVSGISLSGTAAGNYTLAATTTTTTANITQRTLHVTATGQNKSYDGGTSATVSLADDRVTGDAFTVSTTSATFANKNVGTAKTITVSGISIAGTDAANYTANTSTTTTANVTQRALAVTATGQNKIYDGTTAATVTLADNRVAGDVLTTSYTTAVFADKNVGTGKAITVNGISISGTDSANYAANASTTASANITARALTISAIGQNKIYDGTTTATVSLSDNRITGDSLSDSYTGAAFADKNGGNGKAISVSGISISGTDAGNYAANTSAITSANITARALSVSATGQNKVYDGTASAAVTLGDNRIAGDALTVAFGAAAFADKNVGTAKTVSVTGITVGGADAGNYTFNSTASTTADITARQLIDTAAGQNKVYDRNTTAAVTLGDNRIAGDSLTLSDAAANFSDANVGTAKTITVTGISVGGTDSGNYTFNTTATTTADITPLALTVSGVAAVSKPYDGTTAATLDFSGANLVGKISGDVVTLNTATATGIFPSPNVASNITVNVTGVALGGAASGNYTLTQPTTTASITPELLISGTAGVDAITLVQDPDHLHVDWYLNGASVPGQLAINDASGLTMVGNGGADAITLDYSNGNPLPANLHLNGMFTLTNLQGTNPLAGTTLEIAESTLFIGYTTSDPIDAVRAYLQNGYNGGTWDGVATPITGAIVSAAARTNTGYMIGYADSADGVVAGQPLNTIALRYTLGGDLDLSGIVNFNDFATVVANYGKPAYWDGGAFTYGATVSFADFSVTVSNYGKQADTSATTTASTNASSVQTSTTTSASAVSTQPAGHAKPALPHSSRPKSHHRKPRSR
jgi:fibronectin type 3 domain-containing protein